jgi:hypothetical protein
VQQHNDQYLNLIHGCWNYSFDRHMRHHTATNYVKHTLFDNQRHEVEAFLDTYFEVVRGRYMHTPTEAAQSYKSVSQELNRASSDVTKDLYIVVERYYLIESDSVLKDIVSAYLSNLAISLSHERMS